MNTDCNLCVSCIHRSSCSQLSEDCIDENVAAPCDECSQPRDRPEYAHHATLCGSCYHTRYGLQDSHTDPCHADL